MMLVDNHCKIFFGNKNYAIEYDLINNFCDITDPWSSIKVMMGAEKIFWNNQIHDINGLIVSDGMYLQQNRADYLITKIPKVALAVLTADCLPIIIYDSLLQVISIVHAGWRGSVLDIVLVVIEKMKIAFGSQLACLQFFLGPSARGCCYEIGMDVVDRVASMALRHTFDLYQTITHKNGKMFLDLINLHRQFLKSIGVQEAMINEHNAQCTICSEEYCSFRREKGLAKRQVNAVMLT